ncbi:hypothetical protein [Janthinobacterium sp. SUN120]|uniref:hypothetical protein n=1 Tax=Janthinobacterium sp. SUN120 TaxID=3004099 RepID=UPI0025AF7BC8|nr:hypothetical protein [Janthinobacterium sp. SUN120]MDN2716184.1 hypothetical protein [Janthinobacterium sp. SUN120]
MHPTLTEICNNLDALALEVSNVGGDGVISIAHGNGMVPSVDRKELSEMASNLSAKIKECDPSVILGNESRVFDYIVRLQFIRNNTVQNIWNNPTVGVNAYISTIEALERVLEPSLKTDDEKGDSIAIRRLRLKIRAMNGRIAELEPQYAELDTMVARIVNAYEAADQLPDDLVALDGYREKMESITLLVQKNQTYIDQSRDSSAISEKKLEKMAEEAKLIVEKCQSAYTAATSQGLAAAFADRSTKLSNSMWVWVVGLAVSLIIGGIFGSLNLVRLLDLMRIPGVSIGTVAMNMMLSMFSVAAPIWFAWISTKQIGQRFRLAEDYAFKAAVSRAYEGYRAEASRIDKDLELRLLASALDRLDEQPLRLVESLSHGSPWHELMSSDVIKSACKAIPGFANQLNDLAKDALSRVALGSASRGAPIVAEAPKKVGDLDQ